MTTAPNLHMPAMGVDSHVGGHAITEPHGGQMWCEANTGLFIDLLESKPPKSDKAAFADYRDGIDAARDMCSRLCPRFEECLKAAIEGPPIAGFVAGTTPAERKSHREHLRVEPQQEIVDDKFVGLAPHKGVSVDHVKIDAAIRRWPTLSSAKIASLVDESTSAVKRRKRALAETDASPAATDAALTAEATLEEHVNVYYLIRESA